jgi:hypothetical protein
MTKFEKQIYEDMNSTDRILLWMIKFENLMDFSKVLTEEDRKGICEIINEDKLKGRR